MLPHPSDLAKQRALPQARRRIRRPGRRPQQAGRAACEGQGAELECQSLRVLPLVEVPLRDGVRIRGPCPETKRGCRREVLARPLCCDGLHIRTVRIHFHDLNCLLVLVVVHDDELLGPFVTLLAETVDDVLDLALRAVVQGEDCDASNLRQRSNPTSRGQFTAIHLHMNTVVNASQPCPGGLPRRNGRPTQVWHTNPYGGKRRRGAGLLRGLRRHRRLLRNRLVPRGGQAVVLEQGSLPSAPILGKLEQLRVQSGGPALRFLCDVRPPFCLGPAWQRG
mmetsp:Transcript_50622/g.147198  ORF Transcript_50622/g.147198 Transcript_50622/m.147198 type:complete len:279 (+) Transcript_50622:370-1206(+)